ncbi:uncharacterized protein [Bemisia tabaci]|uniref:uncharacterized protein n=1 Tax=Bemisia tabaci TaxID=7038 RepID=UPI003B289081
MDESPLERGNSCSPCIPHLSENETEESALANLISTGGEGTSSGRLASFSPQEPSTRRRRIDLNSDSEPEETTLLRTRTRIIRRPNRGVSTASSRTTQMVTAAVESNENASRRGRQARGRRARTPSFDLVNNINEYDLEEDSSRIGAVHNQMTEWMNRGRYNLNDPTDSSSESDEEEAWQRMVVVADEKMHFTKRQSKKQHSLLKMAVSVGN